MKLGVVLMYDDVVGFDGLVIVDFYVKVFWVWIVIVVVGIYVFFMCYDLMF